MNYEKKDIKYKFITFLIPSIKFHRYANDEIAAFDSAEDFSLYSGDERSRAT